MGVDRLPLGGADSMQAHGRGVRPPGHDIASGGGGGCVLGCSERALVHLAEFFGDAVADGLMARRPVTDPWSHLPPVREVRN